MGDEFGADLIFFVCRRGKYGGFIGATWGIARLVFALSSQVLHLSSRTLFFVSFRSLTTIASLDL